MDPRGTTNDTVERDGGLSAGGITSQVPLRQPCPSRPAGDYAIPNLALAAGSAGDTFTIRDAFSSASVATTVKGGGGSDTLIGRDVASTFAINGPDLGKVDNVTFSSIENLQGGSADDTFAFRSRLQAGSLSGHISGGDGVNTLDFSALSSAVTVRLGTLQSATPLAGGFAAIQKVIGGSASDTLVGPATGTTFTINNGNGGQVGTLAFAGIENLTGGAAADTFVFQTNRYGVAAGFLDGQIDGGTGVNKLDYSAITLGVNVDLSAHT